MAILHLVIPGLLGPWPFSHAVPAKFPQPVAPALNWLLARATVSYATPSDEWADNAVLLRAFGLPAPVDADLPVAALTCLADGGEGADGWWLRADPVHLRPDLHGVFLVDARILAIESAEAQELVTAFNQTFAVDCLQLAALRPDRWYLHLPTAPGLRTHPLTAAIGRDVNPLLPYGPAARRWHTLLTEIQMLFHNHPVNRAREDQNQPILNSVWFWGGGERPRSAQAPAARLYANDPLTRGLARLANATVAPVPEHAGDWLDSADGEPDSLVVLEAMRYDAADGDLATWADHIAELEYAWFTFCRRWLQTGKLAALHLYPGNGRVYTLTSAARWRFWRRPRPLLTHFT